MTLVCSADDSVIPADAPISDDLLASCLSIQITDSNSESFSTYFPITQNLNSPTTSPVTPYLVFGDYPTSSGSFYFGAYDFEQSQLGSFSLVISGLTGSPFRTFDNLTFSYSLGDFFIGDSDSNFFSLSGDASTTSGDATSTVHLIYQYPSATEQFYYTTSFVGEWSFSASGFLQAIQFTEAGIYINSLTITTNFSDLVPADQYTYSLSSQVNETGYSQDSFYNTSLESASSADPVPDTDSSALNSIFDVFSNVGTWIADSVQNLISMFYVDGSLTFLGVLAVAGLAISVIFYFSHLFLNF